ncbi:MAG: hypothetical protein LBN27_04075 [Prevotellaceae bacterium]|jgi:hypothetical protein|nr:hypothetical protein [Prevotellaceae bacterium]
MVHTVYVDDATMAGKKFFRDFSRVRRGVGFLNPATSGIVPAGYSTVNTFFEEERRKTKQFCVENGIY